MNVRELGNNQAPHLWWYVVISIPLTLIMAVGLYLGHDWWKSRVTRENRLADQEAAYSVRKGDKKRHCEGSWKICYRSEHVLVLDYVGNRLSYDPFQGRPKSLTLCWSDDPLEQQEKQRSNAKLIMYVKAKL